MTILTTPGEFFSTRSITVLFSVTTADSADSRVAIFFSPTGVCFKYLLTTTGDSKPPAKPKTAATISRATNRPHPAAHTRVFFPASREVECIDGGAFIISIKQIFHNLYIFKKRALFCMSGFLPFPYL